MPTNDNGTRCHTGAVVVGGERTSATHYVITAGKVSPPVSHRAASGTTATL